MFTICTEQTKKYDDNFKALVGCLSGKFDHRVIALVKHKDGSIGAKMLMKLTAHTKEDPSDTSKRILDKDNEDWNTNPV